MANELRTYLHDHLAGSNFAIELLETMVQRYQDHETGSFASAILQPIREDRGTLERLIERVGRAHADLKDATGWLAEKASRSKLQQDHPNGFGPFEAMEALSLGILGKRALWKALSEVAKTDSRVAGEDYEALMARAQQQFAQVEEYRLRLIPSAFAA